jgi:hypothetical protein
VLKVEKELQKAQEEEERLKKHLEKQKKLEQEKFRQVSCVTSLYYRFILLCRNC